MRSACKVRDILAKWMKRWWILSCIYEVSVSNPNRNRGYYKRFFLFFRNFSRKIP